MIILADSREQTIPIFPVGVTVERATLSEGDYTTAALRDVARIERKNPEDFAASIGTGHDRFFREAERLRAYPFRAIIVEADLSYYLTGQTRSRIHLNAIVGNMCSLHARYGIPTIFASDAATCGRMIAGLLRRLEEEHVSQKAGAA